MIKLLDIKSDLKNLKEGYDNASREEIGQFLNRYISINSLKYELFKRGEK